MKFLDGRNGFGYGRAWACAGIRELRGAVEGIEGSSGAGVSAIETLGSVGGVVDIISGASGVMAAGDALGGVDVGVDEDARFGKSDGGG